MNKKLSLAYVSPGWPLNQFPNGIVTYVQNLLLGLNNYKDITTKVLAFEVGSNADVDQQIINLSLLDKRKSSLEKLQDFFWFRVNINHAIQNISSRRIVTAIQQMHPAPDFLELEESFGLASKIIPKVHCPVITRLHGPWFLHAPILNKEHEQGYKYRVQSEGQAIAQSQGITSPSLDVLNQVRRFYNLELPDAKVIPNPVPEVIASMRWDYSNADKLTILFVGRFDEHKGGDLVLNAFRLVALDNADITLTFVGPDRGIIYNGKNILFSEYIQLFLPEPAISNRIQFLGHCSQEKIRILRKQALITVVASRYESFSISLVEALATGCPVVATAVGGIKEIIIDGYNGLLSRPESAEDLAEKMLNLIDNPDKMNMLSQNAIEDCRVKYHPNVIAQQTLDFYQSLS
jgi:glycosyltransferase involved in cell wall biosynthesis